MKVTKNQTSWEITPERTGLDWLLHQEPKVAEHSTLYKNTLILGYFWKLPKYVKHIGLSVMDIISMYSKKTTLQFSNGWRVKVKIEVESSGIHIVGISEDIMFEKGLIKEFYSLIKDLIKDIRKQFRDELILASRSNQDLSRRYGYLSKFL